MRRSFSHPGHGTIEVTSASAIEHLIRHRPERIQRICFFSHVSHLNQRLSELYHEAKEAGIKVVLGKVVQADAESVCLLLQKSSRAGRTEWI